MIIIVAVSSISTLIIGYLFGYTSGHRIGYFEGFDVGKRIYKSKEESE